MSSYNYAVKKKEVVKKERNTNFRTILNVSRTESAIEPSLYYGFMPIKTPVINPEDIKLSKKISEGEVVVDGEVHADGLWITLPEKVALLRTYEEKTLQTMPQPVMLVYERTPSTDKAKKSFCYGLDIIGAPTSIAEALLIQTVYVMLTEMGHVGLQVEINSIGDKESVVRFTREFSAFYKKNISNLSTACRQAMKKDLFSVLSCTHEKCKELAGECPKSVNFLSERSREHFREIIEHLELSDIPYTINNAIVANRDYCTETIFEIREEATKKTLAVGYRYDGLSHKLGHKRDLPAVGVSIVIEKQTKRTVMPAKTVERIMHPTISYIQLGFEAKIKGLEVIEILRKARIPIAHSLAKNKIAGQVATAERSDVSTVIIMGKKEALENTVIVRNNVTRSQDTVPIVGLIKYLKKIKVQK